ncbi:MAG TPA: peptide-methionine (S)-S-oxide reductase MsrA [Burkholderiales bacterium]|nr:peptide-methionine (S)-S-oxide reductase MsrA [Burkholderiales bacterium]
MKSGATETATLAGGCFWCLEAVFNELRGVQRVVSGYMGGERARPTYEEVCTGTTGHAEVVQITYDPGAISYAEILAVFFVIHDPTTLNRQGNDVGTQYRSAVFFHSEEQKAAAEEFVAKLERGGIWAAPVVTAIVPASRFYPAEDYHQLYYARNSGQPYCRAVVAPKVAKVRAHFLSKLKKPSTQSTE